MNKTNNILENKGKVNPNLDSKIQKIELTSDMKDFQKRVLNILKKNTLVNS